MIQTTKVIRVVTIFYISALLIKLPASIIRYVGLYTVCLLCLRYSLLIFDARGLSTIFKKNQVLIFTSDYLVIDAMLEILVDRTFVGFARRKEALADVGLAQISCSTVLEDRRKISIPTLYQLRPKAYSSAFLMLTSWFWLSVLDARSNFTFELHDLVNTVKVTAVFFLPLIAMLRRNPLTRTNLVSTAKLFEFHAFIAPQR
ncbi:MAG: hypothetical protein GY854_11425 [Deltaproteobacteria bacterium]|nr:hypothetical protein [Deltaproteobacteria bacterium]